MGFSTVAAAAIIGVSFILVINIFSGGVLPTLSDYRESLKNMEERSVNRIQTGINITDITNTGGTFYDLNITVKNIGSITLKTDDFTILINGTNKAFTCNKSHIYSEKDAVFTVNLTGTGLKRVKVITENGISDYGEHMV